MLEEEGLSSEVIEALRCVTKLSDDESYDDFIDRVLTNQLAMRVKLHDLEDNMDLARLDELTDADIKRNQKYQKSLPPYNACAYKSASLAARLPGQQKYTTPFLSPCAMSCTPPRPMPVSSKWPLPLGNTGIDLQICPAIASDKGLPLWTGEYIRFGGLIFLKGAELIFVFLNRQMRLIGIIY